MWVHDERDRLHQRSSKEKEAVLQLTGTPLCSDLCKRTKASLRQLGSLPTVSLGSLRPVSLDPPITELQQLPRSASPNSTITQLEQELSQFEPSCHLGVMSLESQTGKAFAFSTEGNPMQHLCPADLCETFQGVKLDGLAFTGLSGGKYSFEMENFAESSQREEIESDKLWETPIAHAGDEENGWRSQWSETTPGADLNLDATKTRAVLYLPRGQEKISDDLENLLLEKVLENSKRVAPAFCQKFLEAFSANHESVPMTLAIPIRITSSKYRLKGTLLMKLEQSMTDREKAIFLSPGSIPPILINFPGNQLNIRLKGYAAITVGPVGGLSAETPSEQYKLGSHWSKSIEYKCGEDKGMQKFLFSSFFLDQSLVEKELNVLEDVAQHVALFCQHEVALWRHVTTDEKKYTRVIPMMAHFQESPEKRILVCVTQVAEFDTAGPFEIEGLCLDARLPQGALLNPMAFRSWVSTLGFSDTTTPKIVESYMKKFLPAGLAVPLLEDWPRCTCCGKQPDFIETVVRGSIRAGGESPQATVQVLLKKVRTSMSSDRDGLEPDMLEDPLWGKKETAESVSSKFQALGCPGKTNGKIQEKMARIVGQLTQLLLACNTSDSKTWEPWCGVLPIGDGVAAIVCFQRKDNKRSQVGVSSSSSSPSKKARLSNSSSRLSNSSSESSVASQEMIPKSTIPEAFLHRGHYKEMVLGFEDDLEAKIRKLPNGTIKNAIIEAVKWFSEPPDYRKRADSTRKKEDDSSEDPQPTAKKAKKEEQKEGHKKQKKETIKGFATDAAAALLESLANKEQQMFRYSEDGVKVDKQCNSKRTNVTLNGTLSWEEKNAKQTKDNFLQVNELMVENKIAAKIGLAGNKTTKIMQELLNVLLDKNLLTNVPGALWAFGLLNVLMETTDPNVMFMYPPQQEDGRKWFDLGHRQSKGINWGCVCVAIMRKYAGLRITEGSESPLWDLLGTEGEQNGLEKRHRSTQLLLEILPVMYVIMKGFFRRDPYNFMLNCLKEGGEKASKTLWTKIREFGAIDYEHWSQLADTEKTEEKAVPINVYLVGQLLGHATCDVTVTEDLKAACEENMSGHPRNEKFPLHQDFFRSLRTLPSNTLSSDLVAKDGDEYVPVAPMVKYRITKLDNKTGQPEFDGNGKLVFYSKEINFNMWIGKHEDKAKLQPVYDLHQKGTDEMVKERGYEPQYYILPKGPWDRRPVACKVADKVDNYWGKRRYLKLTQVEYKQHKDKSKLKVQPLPSDL